MALVNHAKREINAKIVYYGGGAAGKRALLTYIHDRIRPSLRSELASMGDGEDLLLYFDFSPFEKPVFEGYRLRYHVYTLPGKDANPAAWRMTLKGADGVVIVADAVPERSAEERASVLRLRDFLSAYGQTVGDIPCQLLLDWNGCTQRPLQPVTAAELGIPGIPACCADSTTGEGILEAFSRLSREIMSRIGEERAGWPSECPALDTPDSVPAENPNSALSSETVADGFRNLPEEEVSQENGALPDVSCSEGWEVSLVASGVTCDKGVVAVPLEVVHNGASCRLTVTVTMDQFVETGR